MGKTPPKNSEKLKSAIGGRSRAKPLPRGADACYHYPEKVIACMVGKALFSPQRLSKAPRRWDLLATRRLVCCKIEQPVLNATMDFVADLLATPKV
jgi:hypothetical protein